jgi:hypothetical protein
MSDLFTFNLTSPTGGPTYHLRYNNLKLIRHSSFLRTLILKHGRITFTFEDLRTHKYPHHEAEAFKEVIHWLAENCKAEQFYYSKKQLQYDERENCLWWRGWKNGKGNGEPDFERKVPWLPLDCGERVGGRFEVPFQKALWMYAYMLQLGLDELLQPTMFKLKDGLFEWLRSNVPCLEEAKLLWYLFGESKRVEALSEFGLTRIVNTLHLGSESEQGTAKESETFVHDWLEHL